MHPILMFHTNVSPTVINTNYVLPTPCWGEILEMILQKTKQKKEKLKKLTLRISNLTHETY